MRKNNVLKSFNNSRCGQDKLNFHQQQNRICGEFHQRNCERIFSKTPLNLSRSDFERGSSLLTKIQGAFLIYLTLSAEGISVRNSLKKPYYSGTVVKRETLEQKLNKQEARKILNLSKNATDQEVQKAYRKCAKEFHPDSGKNGGNATRYIECVEARENLLGRKRNDIIHINANNQTRDEDGIVVQKGANSTIEKVDNSSRESMSSRSLSEELESTSVSLLNRITQKVKASSLTLIANKISDGVETIATTTLGLGLLGPMSFLIFTPKVKADFDIPSISNEDIKGVRELIHQAEETQDPELLSKLESIKYGYLNNVLTYWDKDPEIRPYTSKIRSMVMQSPNILNEISLEEILDKFDYVKNPLLNEKLKPGFEWVTDKAIRYAEWKEENIIKAKLSEWGFTIGSRALIGCGVGSPAAGVGCVPGAAIGAVEGVGEILIGSVANAIFGKPVQAGMEYVLDNAVVPAVQFLDPTVTETEAAIGVSTVTSVAFQAARISGIVKDFRAYNAEIAELRHLKGVLNKEPLEWKSAEIYWHNLASFGEELLHGSIEDAPLDYIQAKALDFFIEARTIPGFSHIERGLFHQKVTWDAGLYDYLWKPNWKEAFTSHGASAINYMGITSLENVREGYLDREARNGFGFHHALSQLKNTPMNEREDLPTGDGYNHALYENKNSRVLKFNELSIEYLMAISGLNFGSNSIGTHLTEGSLGNNAGQSFQGINSFPLNQFETNPTGNTIDFMKSRPIGEWNNQLHGNNHDNLFVNNLYDSSLLFEGEDFSDIDFEMNLMGLD